MKHGLVLQILFSRKVKPSLEEPQGEELFLGKIWEEGSLTGLVSVAGGRQDHFTPYFHLNWWFMGGVDGSLCGEHRTDSQDSEH